MAKSKKESIIFTYKIVNTSHNLLFSLSAFNLPAIALSSSIYTQANAPIGAEGETHYASSCSNEIG